MILEAATLVNFLRYRAIHQPDQLAYIFLADDATEEVPITYQDLDREVRSIASLLQEMNAQGERALLLYPSGLEYIIAFFGCLYAGVVAVPAYPPRLNRSHLRIQSIVNDAQAKFALTTSALLSNIQRHAPQLADAATLQWITTDKKNTYRAENWQPPLISGESIAFLQYTSGSTSEPKGVILSHENLLRNSALIGRSFEQPLQRPGVSWLPPYHDMGLIGGIIQPLYKGFPAILMSPTSFIQRPFRWLEAISRYRATISGGPNFAYELCVQKISPAEKATLDLSSWDIAFCGAEPIQPKTLEHFSRAFADQGFQPRAFSPCYGLAEATLFVTGGKKNEPPIVQSIQRSALKEHFVVPASNSEDCYPIIGSGQIQAEQQIIIAHPEQCTLCAPGQVGEIWIAGPSVGQGYWKQAQATKETFHAYLKDTGQGPFLRTGDLGFVTNTELFVTGRRKDCIIIRGQNYYPHDIEETVSYCHPALRPNNCAAFALENAEEERLVVVQEMERQARSANTDEIIQVIRQAVIQQYALHIHAIVLIRPGSLPKTSSGKIQRHACRQQFLGGSLTVIAESIYETERDEDDSVDNVVAIQRERLLALPHHQRLILLQSYLLSIIAHVLRIKTDLLDLRQPIASIGLDSLMAVDLQNHIGRDLCINMPFVSFLQEISLTEIATQLLTQIEDGQEHSVGLNPLPIPRVYPPAYPLSFAQERLWFLHQLLPDTPLYTLPIALCLRGSVNVAALEQSLNEIIRRHETLRTHFEVIDNCPYQVIMPFTAQKLPLIDLSGSAKVEREKTIHELTMAQIHHPFDLSTGPLYRFTLIRASSNEYTLLLTIHHSISDGLSLGIFKEELVTFYAAYGKEDAASLPELPIQYIDYATWQRNWLQGDILEQQASYWRRQLQGAPIVLPLLMDHPRPIAPSFRSQTHRFSLPLSLLKQLTDLNKKEGTTLFMSLFAAFNVLLSFYSGQHDILVGLPIAERNRPTTTKLIGLFVNTLLLRTDLSGNPTFTELLHRVRIMALEAYAHQDLPFEYLVKELRPERTLNYHPLCQVEFTLQPSSFSPLKLEGITIEHLSIDNPTIMFDLVLSLEETSQELAGVIEYNRDLFDECTIERMARHYQQIVAAVAVKPEYPLFSLNFLSQEEHHLLFEIWNGTDGPDAPKQCFHSLFEDQVERTPDEIAVADQGSNWSYKQLNQRANQIAHRLQKLGVGPEVRVGLCTEHSSVDLIVGLLAIFKSGSTYVPLDPTYPQERLAFMLKESQVEVLVTQKDLLPRLSIQHDCVLYLDQHAEYEDYPRDNPHSEVGPENLAYIIYTSGTSTGRPKGVMIAHRGLGNLAQAQIAAFAVTSKSRVLQFASPGFDASISEILMTLLAGATLVIAPSSRQRLGQDLLATLQDERITTLTVPPSLLLTLPQVPLDQLQTLIVAGEDCSQALGASWSQDRHMLNAYGPTEASVCATISAPCNGSQKPPIGRPIANHRIYLLNKQMQPVGIGMPGEIYIGGIGLARGYQQNAALTAERFVPDPFSREEGGRLYKTGDLARFLPNGDLVFLRRADEQIKLRGYRIEIDEIVQTIKRQAGVQEAIVVVHTQTEADKRLVAYVVPLAGKKLDEGELRRGLKRWLPDYMQPSAVVMLEALPLSSNGKIDRNALPDPRSFVYDELTYVAPRTPLEEVVAAIWADVFDSEDISVVANFFDLGGHSLMIAQIHSRLQELFPVDIPLRILFEVTTVAAVAEQLEILGLAMDIDMKKIAQLLLQLSQLSDDETQALLLRKGVPHS